MFYYDIHTHRIQEREDVVSIVNLPDKADEIPHIPNTFFSRGILPEEIPDIFDEKGYFRIREQLHDPRLVAVGECGIDHRITTIGISEQIQIFERMILLSEEFQKPLIIHNVRATGEIMTLYKKYRPTQPWIIHGFRGNIQTAQQLQRLGIWISLGGKTSETLFASSGLDLGRILLETDGKPEHSIQEIYHQTAQKLSMDKKELMVLIRENVQKIFRSLP